jgi:hypothetical protein
MNNKKSIIYLLLIILLLIICFATSIGYIIGNSNASSYNQNLPYTNPNPNDNAALDSQINDLKSVYNSKIAKKTASFRELEIEKNKVQELLAELEKVKGDADLLLKYKEQYQNLEGKMRLLVDEIEILKGNKIKAVSNVIAAKKHKRRVYKTSTQTIPTAEKPIVSEPVKTEIVPEKKIDKVVPDLKITNLETVAYEVKSSDKKEVTQLAKKTNFIKISFTVVGNAAASVEKKYYIQVINNKNNILGAKITEYIDNYTLTYSALKVVQFEGKDVQVDYALNADNFEKGSYIIMIYDRIKLIGKTQLILE